MKKFILLIIVLGILLPSFQARGIMAPPNDPDTPKKFLVIFFANSLLQRLEGEVILKLYFAPDGQLDYRSFYNPEFGIPNVSVDYTSLGLQPVDIEKTIWSREKIQKQAYIKDVLRLGVSGTGNAVWSAFIQKFPFSKIPLEIKEMSPPYSPPEFDLSLSYRGESDPQPNYFALLTKGEFSLENQVVFKEMELGKVLKSDNWFNLFFDLANFPVRDEAFDRSITEEGEFNKDFFAYSISPSFIEDYSLLIHRLGNPVEKLPPDIADIRSKLQTDMGRAVLDKLVEYFATKDKTPATSNAPATSVENINLKDVEAQNMTVYSHYYANSLLNKVSGAVIVKYDKETLDNPLTIFIKSKIDGKSICPADYNLIRVSVEKRVWSDCAISNVIYVLTPNDPGTNNPLNTQIGKFISQESKTIKIPFSKANPADKSSLMTMPHYNFGYDHEERPMKFFIILDSGRFNPDISDKFLTQYSLKTPEQILKKTGLDEILNQENFFSQFMVQGAVPIANESCDVKDMDQYMLRKINPLFIDDYSLLIHKLGNPVEKLPPDVADIRSKLQTDMGRAVLGKLVEYFATKDKTPKVSE